MNGLGAIRQNLGTFIRLYDSGNIILTWPNGFTVVSVHSIDPDSASFTIAFQVAGSDDTLWVRRNGTLSVLQPGFKADNGTFYQPAIGLAAFPTPFMSSIAYGNPGVRMHANGTQYGNDPSQSGIFQATQIGMPGAVSAKTTLGEVVIFEGDNEDDRLKAEGYLAWKWGLVDFLPGGHPYKLKVPRD